MYLAHRWGDRNLTRLELVVSLLLVCLLVFFILQRSISVFAAAEKNHVNYTVANINSALQFKSFTYLTSDTIEKLVEMNDSNPMALMETESSSDLAQFYQQYRGSEEIIKQLYLVESGNYIGELNNPNLSEIEKGSWFFDTSTRKLIYIVINDEFFFLKLSALRA